jgi:hypothetical protein
MSKSTNTLGSIISVLEKAAQTVETANAAEDLKDSLILIPRTPQFWAQELRDLARCRRLVDQHYDKAVMDHISHISSKVDCLLAKSRITVPFLEDVLGLSYSATVDFIGELERKLKTFGHDLPDSLVVFRAEIGLGGPEDVEDTEDTE